MCKEVQENFLQKKFQPFVDNDLQHDSTVSHLNIFFFTISKSFQLKRYFGDVKRFLQKKRLNGHDHYYFDRKYATMGLNSL